jgi:hypothetical protein
MYEMITLAMMAVINGFTMRKANMAIPTRNRIKKYFV